MEVSCPGNGLRGNRCVRAVWQKWVVQLKEVEDIGTPGPHYEMKLEGSK